MKMFSILLAWRWNDHDAGEYSWAGLAEDYDAAVQAAREQAKADNGPDTDEDGEDDPLDELDDGDPDAGMPSTHVLDSMEGVNMWQAPQLLESLKAILDAGHFDDDGDFYIARHSADVYAANPEMLPPDELIERARRVVATAEGAQS